MGEIHEFFVLALSWVWFAGATPDHTIITCGPVFLNGHQREDQAREEHNKDSPKPAHGSTQDSAMLVLTTENESPETHRKKER